MANKLLKQSNVLIIGSGIAGLTAALSLADTHKIHLISKTQLCSGASSWAQGGVAAAENKPAALTSHINDTLEAGAQSNDRKAVELIIEHGQDCITWLEHQGVVFEHEGNHTSLRKEGGHSQRRIYHIATILGEPSQTHLLNKCLPTPILPASRTPSQ